MRTRKHFLRSGFTLLEMILATFIVSASLAGIFVFGRYFFEGYDYSFEETQAVSEAERSVRTIVGELRETRDGEDGSFPLATTNDQELVFFSDVDNDGQTDRIRYYLNGTQLVRQVFSSAGNPPTYACLDNCTICHDPDGTAETITIAESAWPAHQQHGDFIGTCESGAGGSGSTGTTSERVVADFIRNGAAPLFYYYNGDWPGDVISNPLVPQDRLLETKMIEIRLSVDVNTSRIPDPFELSTFVHLRNLKTNL